MLSARFFLERSGLVLLVLVAMIVGFGVSVFCATSLSWGDSVLATVEVMTGGSPEERTEFTADWLRNYGWLVRVSGWLLIPTIMAVLVDEASKGHRYDRQIRLAMERLDFDQFPDADSEARKTRVEQRLQTIATIVSRPEDEPD